MDSALVGNTRGILVYYSNTNGYFPNPWCIPFIFMGLHAVFHGLLVTNMGFPAFEKMESLNKKWKVQTNTVKKPQQTICFGSWFAHRLAPFSKRRAGGQKGNTRGISGIHGVFPSGREIPEVFPLTREIPRVSVPRVYMYKYIYIYIL